MANAAAKKAAAAKEATANVYQPFLIGSNIVYILLLVTLNQEEWSFWAILGVLLTWGLQAFSYVGILDRAKNNNTASASNSSTTTTNRRKDLIGGAHLDLLGLTVVIQYGTALHSRKWFYLLWGVPIWGGWMLYNTFLGGGGKKARGGLGMNDDSEILDSKDSSNKKKREKQRAQKRP